MPTPDPPDALFDRASIDRMAEMAGDQGQAFVSEMAELFRTEGTRSIQELRRAADQADWKAVGRSAHSLKSSAATLGFMRLSAACRALEFDAREGVPGPEVPRLVAEVTGQFEATLPILEDLGRAD